MTRPTSARSEDTVRRLAREIRVWREEAQRGPGEVDDLTLAAYAAGELDAVRRRWVEERLADSPDLAEAAQVVREALDQGDWQAEGSELGARLRLPLVLAPHAPPVERPVPSPRRWSIPRWAAAVALAAAFLLGIALGAAAVGPWLRDAFRVSTERLGGETDATLDSGLTDSAQGNVRRGLSDLKEK